MPETLSFIYREYFFINPQDSAAELDALTSDGWEPVCPASIGHGYLMRRRIVDNGESALEVDAYASP